jgi:hypothetical protein
VEPVRVLSKASATVEFYCRHLKKTIREKYGAEFQLKKIKTRKNKFNEFSPVKIPGNTLNCRFALKFESLILENSGCF